MELPLKEIDFDPGSTEYGVFAMSQVKDPALREHQVFFSNQKLDIKFAVQEEQRIVFAPALIPDMKVYRKVEKQDGTIEEFNLTVSKETIEKIAVDFTENNRGNNVNLEHQDKLIGGVVLFQSIITNENTVPSVKGFEHLPIGTWFMGAKVNNAEVWQGIKDGKYNGWSIHAFFKAKEVEMKSHESLDNQRFDEMAKIILSKL